MSALIKSYSIDKRCSLYHSSFQKPKLKNRNTISGVGCKWFHDNAENPSERVINIEFSDAIQTLIFYWPDNEKRELIPLENIIMPYQQIPQGRVVLRIHMTPLNAIHRVELRFPTPDSRDRFISYITPESSDSANSTRLHQVVQNKLLN